jgi:glycosyltransferase involved in cell wall biosynthesis
LVGKLKLEHTVKFTGPLYGEPKRNALADADFFVLPSQYESFGNSAAEAIACGVPVLVTRGCGIAPLIHERAGLVVECTAEGLREGLHKMLSDKVSNRWQSGCAAIARGLSWDEPADQMELLYASMTATASQTGSLLAGSQAIS